MFERFTEPARLLIVASVREARAHGDDRVGTDHVLLAVLARTGPRGGGDVEDVAEVLERCGLSLLAAEEAIHSRGPSRERPFRHSSTVEHGLAISALAQTTGPIRPRELVASMVSQPDGEARRMLWELGLPAERVLAALAEV
jgi:hypothetical protein